MNQVHPEGKFVVDIDKNIDINDVTANSRVALRSDSYTLHKILPNKVSALDSLHYFTSVTVQCIIWLLTNARSSSLLQMKKWVVTSWCAVL